MCVAHTSRTPRQARRPSLCLPEYIAKFNPSIDRALVVDLRPWVFPFVTFVDTRHGDDLCFSFLAFCPTFVLRISRQGVCQRIDAPSPPYRKICVPYLSWPLHFQQLKNAPTQPTRNLSNTSQTLQHT